MNEDIITMLTRAVVILSRDNEDVELIKIRAILEQWLKDQPPDVSTYLGTERSAA